MNDSPPNEEEVVAPQKSVGEIERELFSKWTIILRNLAGALSILTMCIVAIVNVYTTHLSVVDGREWPSEFTLLILNIGPIICAWTWVNANKTISTIMQGTNLTDRLRNRVADIISTDKKPPQPPPDGSGSNN